MPSLRWRPWRLWAPSTDRDREAVSSKRASTALPIIRPTSPGRRCRLTCPREFVRALCDSAGPTLSSTPRSRKRLAKRHLFLTASGKRIQSPSQRPPSSKVSKLVELPVRVLGKRCTMLFWDPRSLSLESLAAFSGGTVLALSLSPCPGNNAPAGVP